MKITQAMLPKLVGLDVKVVSDDPNYLLINNEIGFVEKFDLTKNQFYVNFGFNMNMYLPGKILVPMEKVEASLFVNNIIDAMKETFDFQQANILYGERGDAEPISRAEVICLRNWAINMIEKTYEYVEIANFLKSLEAKCPFEDLKPFLQIALYKVYRFHPEISHEEIEKLENKLLANPEGFFPEIIIEMMKFSVTRTNPELLHVFQKAKKIVSSGAFHHLCDESIFNTESYIMLCQFAFETENLHIKNYIIKEFEDFLSKEMQDGNENLELLFATAVQLYLEGNSPEALNDVTIYQNIFTHKFGVQREVFVKIFELKIHCYLDLEQLKMSKKCFRELQKYVSTESKLIQKYEDLIDVLECTAEEDLPMQIIESVRTQKKCSLKSCANIELDVRTYLKCGVCGIPHYCSEECQSEHWYAFHRLECQEIGQHYEILT